MWAIRVAKDAATSLDESGRHREEAERVTKQVEAKYKEILLALEEPCALHFEEPHPAA